MYKIIYRTLTKSGRNRCVWHMTYPSLIEMTAGSVPDFFSFLLELTGMDVAHLRLEIFILYFLALVILPRNVVRSSEDRVTREYTPDKMLTKTSRLKFHYKPRVSHTELLSTASASTGKVDYWHKYLRVARYREFERSIVGIYTLIFALTGALTREYELVVRGILNNRPCPLRLGLVYRDRDSSICS